MPSTGIDAINILLRQLLSYDLRLDPQNEANKAFVDGACACLEVKMLDYRYLKRHLTRLLLRVEDTSQKT